jgi:hypothetical protein
MTMLDKYKEEIKRAGLLDSTSVYDGMIGQALIELCETICKQGHSGMSHSITVGLFNQLMTTDLLSPLQGTDDEWSDISDDCYQNKLRSSVFKDKETGECYDIDGGPIFKDINGNTYTCRDSSLRNIKFPYTPPVKREVVDDYCLVQRDRALACEEFIKSTKSERDEEIIIAVSSADESCRKQVLEILTFKNELEKQELRMWANIATWENTITDSDFNHIVSIRNIDEQYLKRGLDAMGITIVKDTPNDLTPSPEPVKQ